MEPHLQGYPIEIYYVAAFIGVILVWFRPKWAFFFVVFSLSVRNFHMAVFTRTSFLGEYLNLNDLFLWIGLLATLRIVWQSERLWLPNILLAIISILLLGDFHALVKYGFQREVIQSIWASWVFPLMFFVAVNVVRSSQDARNFYWALFLGASGAALQHLVFVQGKILDTPTLLGISQIRTISFLASGGIFLVISGFFIDMRKVLRSTPLFIFWVVGLAFIAVSQILSFTRSLWAEGVVTIIALFLLFFRKQKKVFPRLGYATALFAIIIVAFLMTNRIFISDVNLTQMVDSRADFIRDEGVFEEAYQTRESGLETELALWQDGTIIWGVGGSYPPALIDQSVQETGALHHVGFSSYLAHFGVIGLLTYGFLLPLLSIRVGRRYYLHHEYDLAGVVAITGVALAIFDVLSLFSNHHLGATDHIPGLIYGSLWGLSYSPVFNTVRDSRVNMIHRLQPKYLFGLGNR